MSRELVRALTAEAIGSFALVFAGCGAIMVEAKTHQLGHFVRSEQARPAELNPEVVQREEAA